MLERSVDPLPHVAPQVPHAEERYGSATVGPDVPALIAHGDEIGLAYHLGTVPEHVVEGGGEHITIHGDRGVASARCVDCALLRNLAAVEARAGP